MRCSVDIVFPAVLSCSDLKLHQTSEVKNIFKQEKVRLQLTFNPGLTLTGLRTTRPRTIAVHVRYKSLYISLPSSAKQQREMTKSEPEERELRRFIFRISIWIFSLSTFLEPIAY